MKKFFTLIIAFTISIIAVAQENESTSLQKEVGLTFRNLDEFGISYKIGRDQGFWRFNTVFLSGNHATIDNEDFDDDFDTSNFGIGISIGKETRKLIAENLEYRFGVDFSFNYSQSKGATPSNSSYSHYYSNNYEPTKNKYFTPGFNLVLGLNYIIKEHLVLGVELMPYISYTFGESSVGESYNKETTEHSNFKYGVNSSSVLLSLAYRF